MLKDDTAREGVDWMKLVRNEIQL